MKKRQHFLLEWDIDKTVDACNQRWLTKRIQAYPEWKERVAAGGENPEEVYRGLLKERQNLLDNDSTSCRKSGKGAVVPLEESFDESMAQAVIKLEAYAASMKKRRRSENAT